MGSRSKLIAVVAMAITTGASWGVSKASADQVPDSISSTSIREVAVKNDRASRDADDPRDCRPAFCTFGTTRWTDASGDRHEQLCFLWVKAWRTNADDKAHGRTDFRCPHKPDMIIHDWWFFGNGHQRYGNCNTTGDPGKECFWLPQQDGSGWHVVHRMNIPDSPGDQEYGVMTAFEAGIDDAEVLRYRDL
jgi:hypothetical protein